MVTQAVGGAASRSISLTLSARDDGSVRRVFGRVSRELQRTGDRLSEVRAEQRRLRAELRETERGTEAYRDLERQIEQTQVETRRLTREVGEQQAQWGRLTGRAERYGSLARNSILGVGAAATALLFTVTQVGEQMTQALAITDETGLAVEEIQRIQNALGAVGRTLDANDFQEFGTRLGDARQQMIEGTGPVFEALERIGLRADQLSIRDLPRVIRVLEAIPDAATRAFEADEILGGQLGESYRFYWGLPDDVRQDLEDVSVLTRAEAEEMVRAAAAAREAGGELRQLGIAAAGALVPALEGVLDILTPIVRAIGAFTQANPALVQTLATLGASLAVVTTTLWGLNAAKAAALALAGPQGWVILGAAAGLLAVGGIVFAGAQGASIRQRREQEAREQDRQERLAALFAPQGGAAVATQMGAQMGTRQGIIEAAEQVRQRQLRSILPGVPAEDAGAQTPQEAPPPPPVYTPPDHLVRGVEGRIAANLEGAGAAGLTGAAGAAIIAQSYVNEAQAAIDEEFGHQQARAGALQQTGNLGLLALARFREGAAGGAEVVDLNPAPLPGTRPAGPAAAPVSEPFPFDPDAVPRLTGQGGLLPPPPGSVTPQPLQPPPAPQAPAPVATPQAVAPPLAENVVINVQPRADDAVGTAEAVRETVEQYDNARRGE